MTLDKNAEKKFLEETAKKLQSLQLKFDLKKIEQLMKTGQVLIKDPENPY